MGPRRPATAAAASDRMAARSPPPARGPRRSHRQGPARRGPGRAEAARHWHEIGHDARDGGIDITFAISISFERPHNGFSFPTEVNGQGRLAVGTNGGTRRRTAASVPASTAARRASWRIITAWRAYRSAAGSRCPTQSRTEAGACQSVLAGPPPTSHVGFAMAQRFGVGELHKNTSTAMNEFRRLCPL